MVRNRMRASNAGTGAVAEHREARARTTSPRRPRRARPASAAPAPPRPAARGPPPLASSDRPAVPRSSREQRLPCAARARSIDRHGALLSLRPMTVVASSETNDSATAATSPALASPSRTKRRAVLAEAGRGARIPGRGVPAASDICTPAPSPVRAHRPLLARVRPQAQDRPLGCPIGHRSDDARRPASRQAAHIVQSGHAPASRHGSPKRARAPRPRHLARVIMCPPPGARRVGPCPHTSTQRHDAPPRRTRGTGGARRTRRARLAGRPGTGQMRVRTRSGRPRRPRRR